MSDPTIETETKADAITNGATNGSLPVTVTEPIAEPAEPPQVAAEASASPTAPPTASPAPPVPVVALPQTPQTRPPAHGPRRPTSGRASAPQAPPFTAPTPAAATPAPQTVPSPLRLRLKVWTDPQTKKRYLMPTALLDPRTGVMTAYGTASEGDDKVLRLTPPEWQALPFFYFKEDQPA